MVQFTVQSIVHSPGFVVSHLDLMTATRTTKPNYLTPAAYARTGNEAKLGKRESGIPAPYLVESGVAVWW